MNAPAKFTIEVETFMPMRSNALVGLCTLRIVELRLHMREVPILQSHGRRWAALSSKPQIDKDGRAVTDASGKRQYVAILQWDDRATSDRFSERVIEQLLARYPLAFDPES